MCNLPVSKCCCCIPLRTGLIIWGYFRLILAVTPLLLILHEVSTQFSAKGLAILLALLSFLVANVVFTITFLIGAYKKNYKLLRIYYSFNIFSLSIAIMGYFIFVTLQVVLTLSDDEDGLGFPSLELNVATLIYIFLDIYFILLVRRQILILKNQRTYYINDVQGTSVVLNMPLTKEQERNASLVYTDSESEENVGFKMYPVKELERLKEDLEKRRK